MDEKLEQYYERLERIGRARSAGAAAGGADGLVAKKPSPRIRFRFTFRTLLSLVVLMMLVKGYVVWHFGEAYMAAWIEAWLLGEPYERLAAYALTPDPVSDFVAFCVDHLVDFLRD